VNLELHYPTIEVSAAATLDPVSLDEAKEACDYEGDDRDGQFRAWIKTATEAVEHDCERALCTQTCKLYLPCFPCEIEIPKPPVASITSITYTDTAGTTQTLATSVYQSNLKRTPPRIREAYSQQWPQTRDETENAVTVTFVAGYGEPKDVPFQAKEAVLLMVKRHYEGCTGDAMSESPIYRGLVGRLRWRPL
jgi:uncharacterized phiE125 gp8 family phage protein